MILLQKNNLKSKKIEYFMFDFLPIPNFLYKKWNVSQN